MKILVIEDDLMYQHIIKGHIKQYDSSIQVVTWNKVYPDKLELLDKFPPDIILLGFFLKNSPMSGYEFLKHLRKKKMLPDSKVIMMTSNNTEHDIKRVLKLHIHAYLIKPIVRRTLYLELDKIREESEESTS